jgi:outer membrane protein assembly factor BamB
MSENIQAMRCPSCGGPIQFEDRETLVTCHFCGTQVKREPEHQPEVEQQRVTFNLEQYMPAAQPKRSGAVVGILIGVVLVIILGITFFSIAMVDNAVRGVPNLQEGIGIGREQIFSISGAQVLDASQPEILLTAYLRDSTYRYVYLDFSAEAAERWRSEPLPEEYYRATTMFDEQAIYVVLKTEMYALSRANGAELWRVKLSDELAVACDLCMIKAGDQVVVLTNDGQLAANNMRNGNKTWGVMLDEPTRKLVLLDGKPAVWDKSENGAVVRIFDLATGQEAMRISPSGPNDPFPDDPQTPDVYSPLLVDADGKSFYTLFGTFEPLSIQRWDAQTGQLVWQTLAPDDFSSTSVDSGTGLLLSGGFLFMADQGTILSLDTVSGTLRSFEVQEEYVLTPLAVQQGKLLVSASRQRGTSRDELWAFDLNNGSPAWKVIPEAQTRKDDQSGFVDSDGEWIIQMVNGGVILLQFQNEPMGMTYQRIDLTSGVGGAQKTMLPPGQDTDSTSLYLNTLLWQNEKLWYAGDRLYLIDLAYGQSTVKWP